MKNYEIMAIIGAYTAGKEEGKKLVLPASVAWKRRLNMKALMDAKGVIDEAIRDIQKDFMDDEHSEAAVMDNGEEGRKIKKEFIPEYSKRQTELFNQETDVAIKKIKIGEIEGVDLDDEDLDTLAFMIEEEKDG